MIKLAKTLGIGLCATILMFSCSKDMEDVNPSSTLSGVSTDELKSTGTVSTVDPLSFSSLSTTDGKTWSFTVQKVAELKSDINSLMLTLTGCDDQVIALTDGNVTSASVSNNSGTDTHPFSISFKDNGKACDMSGVTGFVRLTLPDDVAIKLTDGRVYTVSITLKDAVRVKSANIWAKTGNDCQTAVVKGPGCELDLCGEGQGSFHKEGSWKGKTVTLGGYTYSETEGIPFITSDKKFGGKDNAGGIADSKAAFAQGATVLLNRQLGNISPTAYAAELAIIDEYLHSLGKSLTEFETLPTGNEDAKAAAGIIGELIDCEEATGE